MGSVGVAVFVNGQVAADSSSTAGSAKSGAIRMLSSDPAEAARSSDLLKATLESSVDLAHRRLLDGSEGCVECGPP